MDKLFLEKFRELNCQKKYIIDNDSLSICEGNIILPNGYYIGGYFSYKTYIVDSFDNLVGVINYYNNYPTNRSDDPYVEIKSRVFKEDVIKQNNEVVEKRNKYKEKLLKNMSIQIEEKYDSIYLSQAINRMLCGNYDFFDEKMKIIKPFEVQKTMVDTLESIGMDEARLLSFSAIRKTYIEYIKMEKETKKNLNKTLIKS